MADHGEVEYATAEGNDLPAHEANYESFIHFTVIGTVLVVNILVGLAIGGVLGHWLLSGGGHHRRRSSRPASPHGRDRACPASSCSLCRCSRSCSAPTADGATGHPVASQGDGVNAHLCSA